MRHLILVAALLALMPLTASAEFHTYSMERIYTACRGALRDVSRDAPIQEMSDAMRNGAECAGYIAGFIAAIESGGTDDRRLAACLGRTELARIMRVLVRYLDEHPKAAALDGGIAMRMVLSESYGCAK